ncbi:unnamed protein product [Gordionus sp. m RMFG-2023]|uniref:uncharacterized protein LOC135926173 n=1 Tax=Gordionus sp. m RMFG-2023 TaxID=3053472 RepID=UPI0030E5963D
MNPHYYQLPLFINQAQPLISPNILPQNNSFNSNYIPYQPYLFPPPFHFSFLQEVSCQNQPSLNSSLQGIDEIKIWLEKWHDRQESNVLPMTRENNLSISEYKKSIQKLNNILLQIEDLNRSLNTKSLLKSYENNFELCKEIEQNFNAQKNECEDVIKIITDKSTLKRIKIKLLMRKNKRNRLKNKKMNILPDFEKLDNLKIEKTNNLHKLIDKELVKKQEDYQNKIENKILKHETNFVLNVIKNKCKDIQYLKDVIGKINELKCLRYKKINGTCEYSQGFCVNQQKMNDIDNELTNKLNGFQLEKQKILELRKHKINKTTNVKCQIKLPKKTKPDKKLLSNSRSSTHIAINVITNQILSNLKEQKNDDYTKDLDKILDIRKSWNVYLK